MKSGNIEIKLSRNLRCPLGNEVVLGNIVFCENCIKLSIAEVLVLVKQIALTTVFGTKSLQVGNNLGNLESVGVIRKRERCVMPENLVCYCTV